MKTVAFESFWRHLDKMHLSNPHITDMEYIETAARVYLDVNPEGMLLREAHDIMDELRMIGRIYLQQLRIAKHFSKALQDINEQASPPTSRELVKEMRNTIEDLNDLQTTTSPDGGVRSIITNGIVDRPPTPEAKKPIPNHTIYRAKYLVEDIETRQNELKEYVFKDRIVSRLRYYNLLLVPERVTIYETFI
jgi:hypothetical protein